MLRRWNWNSCRQRRYQCKRGFGPYEYEQKRENLALFLTLIFVLDQNSLETEVDIDFLSKNCHTSEHSLIYSVLIIWKQ